MAYPVSLIMENNEHISKKLLIITVLIIILFTCGYQDYGPYGYGGDEDKVDDFDYTNRYTFGFQLEPFIDYLDFLLQNAFENIHLYIQSIKDDEFNDVRCKLVWINNGTLIILTLDNNDNVFYIVVTDSLDKTGNIPFDSLPVFVSTLFAGNFALDNDEVDVIMSELGKYGYYSDGYSNISYEMEQNVIFYYILPEIN